MKLKLSLAFSIAVATMLVSPHLSWGEVVGPVNYERMEGANSGVSQGIACAGDNSSCSGLNDYACGCDETCCGPLWIVTADAVFLERRSPASAVLMFNTQDASQNLNASSFDFPFQAGVDVSLARHFGRDNALEVRYFGVDQWNATATTTTTPGNLLQVNAAHPIFVAAGDSIGATDKSELHNFEVNGLHSLGNCLTLLAGFRYAELDEDFTATLIGSEVPFSYDARTRNRLYGFQLGGKASLWDRGGPLTIEGVGKAGVYANRAAQDSAHPLGVVTLPASGNTTATAFLGEVGATGSYRFTEHFSLRGGYRLLWIDGVALATDQVAVSNFIFNSGLKASGDAFYHGAFVGFEYVR